MRLLCFHIFTLRFFLGKAFSFPSGWDIFLFFFFEWVSVSFSWLTKGAHIYNINWCLCSSGFYNGVSLILNWFKLSVLFNGFLRDLHVVTIIAYNFLSYLFITLYPWFSVVMNCKLYTSIDVNSCKKSCFT